MGLDLYSKIEPYLGFEEEIYNLHNQFMKFVFENDLDNIVDIGCGQGYFLENLNLNGKKAFGVDLSIEQIKVCEEKGLDAKAIPLDQVEEKFDCATAIFDVLNYMDKEYLKSFIKDVYNTLNQDGYFIFDVNSYFGFEEVAQGCINLDLEDKFIAIDAIFEEDKLKTNLTLFTEEKDKLFSKESDFIVQEYHSTEFLKKVLKKSGFKIEQINEFNLHSDDEADKLIFICKKD
jgi:predicted TPR repeat methyltransferase